MRPVLLTKVEKEEALAALPGWEAEGEGLVRWFEWESFAAAVEFVRKVAEVAEWMDHHPDIDLRYRRVRLFLTTHSAGGVTALDVEFARWAGSKGGDAAGGK